LTTILSLGAGVNSTALLCLAVQGDIPVSEVIFADTGGESIETQLYLANIIEPFCAGNDLTFTVVKREGPSLYEYCLQKKIVPSRQFGWCRDKWKIQPIKKYLKQNYNGLYVHTFIGFCKGEEKRAKHYQGYGTEYSFPLLKAGITRDGCKALIRSNGLPLPPKSGCIFCPYQPLESWIKLYRDDPQKFQEAEKLEKNGKRYPDLFLGWDYRLENLRHILESTQAEQRKYQVTELLSWMPKIGGCGVCEIETNHMERP